MRFLRCDDDGKLVLTGFIRKQADLPQYAILSHTWLDDNEEEVTLQDLRNGTAESKSGFAKIQFCARQAKEDGLHFIWIDTCCIDKRDPIELSESINSMFEWYRKAAECYVYLTDVSFTGGAKSEPGSSQPWTKAFRNSKWFTRGWTLQELLAPKSVSFFSKEWQRLGNKRSLEQLVHEITNIPIKALQGQTLSGFTVQQRLSWAEDRITTRKEDKAYCLFGIFEVYMPLIYGEGGHAFTRLRKEIEGRHPEDGRIEQLLDTLPTVASAAFDSRESEQESEEGSEHGDICLPKTRVELLQQVTQWRESPGGQSVFWLNGTAGTGKSTIARTVATHSAERGELGGTFFFSKRGGDAGHADKLVTTLAHQIACKVASAKQYICEAIMENRDITGRALREQWKELIVKPLSRIHSDFNPTVIVMIIDALDECSSPRDVDIIVRLFGETTALTNVRVRIFITGRPELHIRRAINRIPSGQRREVVLHDLSPAMVERDLEEFFSHRLKKIREMQDLDEWWPSDMDVAQLVGRSSRLFIWAATACRYISEGNEFAIRRMMKLISGTRSSGGPQQQLDQIYLTILKESLRGNYEADEAEEHRRDLETILATIVTVLWPLSIDALAALLGLRPSSISMTLRGLHSIINIPEGNIRPVRLHHPSFREFVLDQGRCKDIDFRIEDRKAHIALAKSCVQLMNKRLCRNICKLSDPGASIDAIPHDTVNRCIPPELRYACLNWAEHLRQGHLHLRDDDDFHLFLQKHFLHWVEAVSLCRRTSYMAPIMRVYQSLLEVSQMATRVWKVLLTFND